MASHVSLASLTAGPARSSLRSWRNEASAALSSPGDTTADEARPVVELTIRLSHQSLVEDQVNLGRLSSAALMLSGLAGVVMPTKVASALELPALSGRAVAETRAGLGGTYTALGGWALFSAQPVAQAAVGVTWLGAAAARLGSLVVDRPRTDTAFWLYLAAEIGFGVAALAPAKTHPSPAVTYAGVSP